MATTISKGDNIIDSRDVIARIEELEGDRETLSDAVDSAREALQEHQDNEPDEEEGEEAEEYEVKLGELKRALVDAAQELDEWDEGEDAEELKELKAFAEEGEGCDDWEHGCTCIHESYFTEYCQDLVSDIGDMPKEIPHYIVIDWEATANNLRADYTSIEWGGETYLVR